MRAPWRKCLLIALALAMPSAALPSVAYAQFGQIGSYNQPKTNSYPTVSPYLNLGRGGSGNAAINYYGIVKPQIETNRAFQQLDPSLFGGDPRFGYGAGGGQIGPDGNPIPGTNQILPNQAQGLNTGHPATYFYYSHYYQFQNGQRAGGGVGGNAGGAGFGRPGTSATPFFAGSGGVFQAVNPGGANPLGGGLGGGIYSTTPSTGSFR